MAAAAWLQILPVILLLGAPPSPLSLLGAGPVPVAAADRSKWHIPIPSVSVPKPLSLEEGGGGTTAAHGVHEGSAKVRFQRGGIAGSVLAGASLGPTSLGAGSRGFLWVGERRGVGSGFAASSGNVECLARDR